MPNLVENRYRDHLAEHLDLIEQGLSLVDSELLLPNAAGAKGFVDLVARDKYGTLVLIEIKRSDSAARSAMHELFKYVALVRENYGLAKHQVRCVLLSTTWHELLVPFSELHGAGAFELSGKKLIVGPTDLPTGVEAVEPLIAQASLSLCPKHEILLYATSEARSQEMSRVVASLEQQQVTDYFLIVFDHDRSDTRVIYPYALYVVLAELSAAQRAAVQQRQLEEWHAEYLADGGDPATWEVDDSDLLDPTDWGHEEEVLTRINELCEPSEISIGDPDKLRSLHESWRLDKIVRSGRFSSQLIWPDDQLLMAALAVGDKYTTLFVSQVSTSNPTACARLLENVSYSLQGAKGWQKQVPKLLNQLISDPDVDSVSIQLYSPCDLLFGLSALASGRTDALPALEIIAESASSGIRHYSGALVWDGVTKLDAAEAIERVVPRGAFWYLMSRHAGAQWEDESRYCQLHGLRYALYEAEYADDPRDAKFWRLRIKAASVVRAEVSPSQVAAESAVSFAAANEEYLDHLADELFRKLTIGSGL